MSIKRIIPFILMLSIAFTTLSCKSYRMNRKRKKDAREIEKKKREREAEANAKYRDAIRHQADIQSPKTKRAMKKRYKQADRYNNHKREFFLKRWFTPKHKRKATPPV